MITVTMTSLPNRLHIAQYALKSIELQTLQPDRVVINIDKNQFNKESQVRDQFLISLDWEKIDINLTDDIGPHTKLLPVLRTARDNNPIVTIDDDIIYSPWFLERIIRCGDVNRDCVVCGRAREIRRNIFGGYQAYLRWPNLSTYKKDINLLPLGVGGVLYRRSFFSDETLFNGELVSSAPHADDLTFKVLGYLNNVNVVFDPNIYEGSMEIHHSFSLMYNNWRGRNFNDFLNKGVIGKKILNRLQYAGFCGSRNDAQWRQLQQVYLSLKGEAM